MPPVSITPSLYQQPDFHPEDPSLLPVSREVPIVGGRLVVPLHWGKIWGVDFGINQAHPFAAVLAAWDRDSDVLYILKTIRIAQGIPDTHVAAMKRICSAAPVAWPHDGNNRDKGSGETLASQYSALGARMLPHHSTFPDGGYSTEAAVMEMDTRMQTGRLRVCEDLIDWWQEYRLYHREKGQIVKIDDDLLSATQKIIMMKRFARTGPIGFITAKENRVRPTSNTWDVFTGLPFDEGYN